MSTFAVALFLDAMDVIYIAFRVCSFGRRANCLLVFIWIIYKIQIPALRRTQNVPTVETNLSVLCREIIRVYCYSHKKHVNILCGQNAEFLRATAYGPYVGLCVVTVYHKRIKQGCVWNGFTCLRQGISSRPW